MKFPSEIHPFLKSHKVSVLTVLMKDGLPHAASLHYAWHQPSGSFIFITRKHTIKYQQLVDSSQKAALVIGFSEEEFCTIQMRGEAKILESEDLKEAYFEKFSHLRSLSHDDSAAFLVFEPTWFRYSDLKSDKPVILSSEQ